MIAISSKPDSFHYCVTLDIMVRDGGLGLAYVA